MFTRDEICLILDSMRRQSDLCKHGGGSNWKDYYLVHEPVIEKIKAVLDSASCWNDGSR